ncbi:hypothetical protein VTN77DRAFT_5383 [Rasamsonia byssochlamydoides]|uniref:uncharacterized protein n=1 Tax=Rasamsonia byssochlamydoides TaxID=89139 RepID=UPI003743D288
MATLPSTQSAIVANATGDLVLSPDIPLPDLEPDMILVKTVAVALNPVDTKVVGKMATKGAIAGGDFAGIVVALGSGASRFAIEDRVCGAVQSMNPLLPRVGAFAEYVAATADFTLKIPDNMSFESAATLGIGVATIGYALFRSLKIPGDPEQPASKPNYVLVYGGSTASGTMAIQLVRRSGLIPITTCSPRNFPLVERYGAEKAFDYHSPTAVDEIRKYTKNALVYALDCFCDASSMIFCYGALGRAGGRYTTLEPYLERLHTRKTVKPDWVLGPALFGKKIAWNGPYGLEGDPQLRVFGREWFLCAQRMLDRGEIVPHPARVGEKIGLEGVLDGLELLRKRAVSGEKLVYRVAES